MSHVAEFTIEAAALSGGRALESMPDMTVEVERVVPTGESTFPFLWIWGGGSRHLRGPTHG